MITRVLRVRTGLKHKNRFTSVEQRDLKRLGSRCPIFSVIFQRKSFFLRTKTNGEEFVTDLFVDEIEKKSPRLGGI